MFKIGEFSRISQVTVQTLRYYDDIGLLTPSYVDHATGYRYYALDLLPRLNRILALKDLGLSLDEITLMLRDAVSVDELKAILRLKLTELEAQRVETESRIMRVTARLHWIEKESDMPAKDVVLKPVEAIRVLALRRTVPTWDEFPARFGDVTAAAAAQHVVSNGPWIAIYHDPEWVTHDIDLEIALPVPDRFTGSLRVPPGDAMTVSTLPRVDCMASLLHQGPYVSKGETMVALAQWIAANGYQFAGPVREVYLHGPLDTDDPAAYLTEVQVPVTPNPLA